MDIKHHGTISFLFRRGPLVRSWAMRFEAKHSYFKKCVDKLNNFKNIDYSLAKRHQALQAYLLQTSAGSLFNKAVQHGPGLYTCVWVGVYIYKCTRHDLEGLCVINVFEYVLHFSGFFAVSKAWFTLVVYRGILSSHNVTIYK